MKLENGNLKYRNRVIVLLLLFTVLTPDVTIGSLPAFRLEQLMAFFVAVHFIMALRLYNHFVVRTSRLLYVYILFPIIIVFSSLVGSFKGYPAVLSDLFEIYKVLVYALIYLIVSSCVVDEDQRTKVLKLIVLFISFSAVISLTQYVNLFGLNELYIPKIAPTQYVTLVDGYATPRVVGMSSNPNVYSVIAAIGFLISLWLFLELKRKLYILSMALTLTANLMTLSRSGFGFLVVSCVVMVISQLRIQGISLRAFLTLRVGKNAFTLLAVSMLMLVTVIALFLYVIPDDLLWRLERMRDLAADRSWQTRLYGWSNLTSYVSISPLFGIGPGKLHMTGAADNEWLLLLARYGIVGTVFLVAVFLSPLTSRRFRRNRLRPLYYAILSGAAVYMIPAAIYHSFQLMALVMIVLGCVVWEGDLIRVRV